MKVNPYQLSLDALKESFPYSFPNPSVGAVIVKNELCIGYGYTQPYPGKHAEIMAIESVENKLEIENSTLYVTLMPCSHYGNNPPCTDSIIKHKIKEVIVALNDINPLVVNNKSQLILEKNGVKVCYTYPESIKKKCFLYNETFFYSFLTQELPFITLKYAMTLDGKIADFEGNSKWISNEVSRNWVHKTRVIYDGVLVGERTVLKDDPLLTARISGNINYIQPTRVVLNLRTKLDSSLNIFNKDTKTLFILGDEFSDEYLLSIKDSGHDYMYFDKSLYDTLVLLKNEYGLNSLLVEGGAHVLGQFYHEKCFHKMQIYMGNKILSDAPKGLSPIFYNRYETMNEARSLTNINISILGEDNVLYEGYRTKEDYFFRLIK